MGGSVYFAFLVVPTLQAVNQDHLSTSSCSKETGRYLRRRGGWPTSRLEGALWSRAKILRLKSIHPWTCEYAEVIHLGGLDTTDATKGSKRYASISHIENSRSYVGVADSEEKRRG
jgi:hypothetical protein